MEQFNLVPSQTEKINKALDKTSDLAAVFDLQTPQTALASIRGIKTQLELLKNETNPNILKYDLDLRRDLAERLALDYISEFSEGLARAEKFGMYYFIDKNGNDVFPNSRFYQATNFKNNFAAVIKKGKYYFINKNGEDICKGQRFDEVEDFVNGFAKVKKNDKWYFINERGQNICRKEGFSKIKDFQDGLALVKMGPVYYFINEDGENAFQEQDFELANSFNDGFAKVKTNDKWYFINEKGEDVFKDKGFDNVLSDFNDGFAMVKKDGKYYPINQKGEIIFNEGMGIYFVISEGIFLISRGSKYYFIDLSSGEYIEKEGFGYPPESFKNGLAKVQKDGRVYFINKKGEDIFHGEKFDEIKDFQEAVVWVRKASVWYIVSENGEIIKAGDFDFIHNFENGLAAVNKDHKWYFVNKKGQEICNGERFDWVNDFSDGDGVATVGKNGVSFRIDIHGQRIFSKEEKNK